MHQQSLFAQQRQDVQEYLDDVDVQKEGGRDVLVHAELYAFASDDHLSVDDQVDPEEHHPKGAV